MAEIRALVADDEPLARRGIRQLLVAHPDVRVVGESRNGREVLEALDSSPVDLLFLDVQMPELDGFGVLRERGCDRMPAVVFVTAYDEFAVRAFEACALDYLVKPVSEARFSATMTRVRERLRASGALELAARLSELLARGGPSPREPSGIDEPPVSRRLSVPTRGGTLLLHESEVDWIQADDYYAIVHAGGRRHLLRESLASLERRLPPARFLRVHRGALVCLEKVRELRAEADGESVAVLADGSRVPVSRRRREALASRLRSG